MNSTFKKVALASALLASSALVAPQAALAASAGVAATTTAGTASAFNAPFTTAFQAAYGMRATISITVDGTATNVDRYELVGFLYDASNNYVGFVRGAGTTGASATVTDTVTLPSSSSGATKVSFAFIPKASDDAAANLDDTINGATAGTRALLVVPGAAENAATFSAVTITANASLTAGATATELNTIGALTDIKNGAVALTSAYTGPTLVSAGKDALTPAYIKLSFDTLLGSITDNVDLAAVGQIKPKAGSTIETTVTEHNGKTTAGKDVYIAKAAGGGAFSTAIDAVDISFLAGNSVTNSIRDKAGNHAKAVSGVTVSQFAKPAYAASGKVMIGDNLTANTSGLTIADMFTTAGSTAGDATGAIDVNIRMAESIGSNVNAADDFALSSGLTFGSVQQATGTTLKVRVTLGAGKWRFNSTSGELQRSTDNGTTWTSQTVGLAVGANAVTTSENQALTAALATTAVVAGAAPAVGNVSTVDADANGTVDGATIDYKAPLTTPLAATNGVKVQDDDDTTKTAAVTLSVPAATPNVLQIVSPEATLESYLETTETKAANMNTGAVGATLPYTVAVTSSEITYANVFDVSTGANKKIADVSAASPANDGAKPIVLSAAYLPEEGTSPAAGQLKIVASEALNNVTALDSAQIVLGGASLQLLNLNDGVKALGAAEASRSKTTIDNDTVSVGVLGTGNGKVTANVSGKALTFGAASSGLTDAASNNLTTVAAGVNVTTGSTVFAGPKIAQAIGTRSTNAVDGNIDQVVLKFDKGVTLASGGAKVDGMFKVKATVDGTNYTVSVLKDSIDLTAAATGYVTLTLPTPGIVGSTKLTSLVVEYDANGAGNLGTTTANRLISTDAVASEITDTNSSLTAGENDGDTRDVTFAKNTTKLYTMEVTGSLTTDGSAAAAKGTIVRADLVDFDTTLTFKSGSMTVPCSCTAGSTTIAVTGSGNIVTKLNEAVKLGKTSINAFANVNVNAQTASAMVVNLDGSVGGDKSYPITISTSGAVTGTAGATGTLVLEKTPALKVLDTVYQVTNTGAFRFAVGSDTAPTNGVVLVSSKQPADKFFTGLTSAVPSFANYLPFASNVVASGVIGGNLGTVNLAKIASSSVSDTTGWQLVGFQGTIARNSNAALKATPVDATRLLVSVRPTTGEPATAWAFDTAANADDEAFLLQNNVTASALQIGSASIDGLKTIDGGLALALKNLSGGFTRDQNGNGEITSGDANTGISATEPFSVFYPISGDSTAFNATAGKWSLLTVEQAVASANLSSWTTTNKVAAIIVVGSGNAQKSWFKGSTTNTLTALAKGDRAFIYFEGANTAFKFGR